MDKDMFEEWWNLPIEDRYQDAKRAYLEKFPAGTISDFHLMEIEFWKNRLKDPKKYPTNSENYSPREIKFVVEGRKMLDYYEKLEKAKGNASSVGLKQIFDSNKNGLAICLQLFKELEIIDINGEINSQVKSNEILGLAVALKESSQNLLRSDKFYSDEYLMKILQQHLLMKHTPNIKRRGKGYEIRRKEAIAFINAHIKKTRVD